MARPDGQTKASIVSNWFKMAARDGQGGVCQKVMDSVEDGMEPTEEDIIKSARTVDFNGDIDTLKDLVSCCPDEDLAKRILNARLQNFRRIGWGEKEEQVRSLIRKLSIHAV